MGLTFIQPNAAAQPRSSCVEQGAITRGQERWIQRESGLGIWRSHSVVQVGWGELRKHDEQIITVTRCSHSVGIASCRNRSLRRSTTIPSDLRSLLVGSISITGLATHTRGRPQARKSPPLSVSRNLQGWPKSRVPRSLGCEERAAVPPMQALRRNCLDRADGDR